MVRLARLFHRARNAEPDLGGDLGLLLPRRPAAPCRLHAGRDRDAPRLPRGDGAASANSVAPAHATDDSGHRRVLLLRLDTLALPDVAAAIPAALVRP